MKAIDFLYQWAGKFLAMLMLVLTPIHSVMIAVLLLVIADFVTGVYAAHKQKHRITSRGFRRTAVKLVAFLTGVVMAFVIETYLLQGVPLVKVVSGAIALSEGKSFFENLNLITGVDFWKMILEKMSSESTKGLPQEPKE